MKKIWILAAIAMGTIVSCNKEENISSDKNNGNCIITAYAPAETRTIIDGLDVKWAQNDQIAVFDEEGTAYPFDLVNGAGSTEGVFSGNAPTAIGYAVYPYTENASLDTDMMQVAIDYPTTYKYAAVTVPMFGEEDSTNPGKYAFTHVGGAFKISYTNVPEGASKFVFTTSDNNIAGTAIYSLSDNNASISTGTKVVTVTDLPATPTLDFIIPVPAGSYTFNVKILDSNNNVLGASERSVSSSKSVEAGHLKPLQAIKVKAENNEILWSEDFTGCDDDDQPELSTTAVFGGGYASYDYTGSYTKVYATNSLFDTPPELLIARSSRAETWTVSNIPTGAWTTLTLRFKSNHDIAVTSTSATVGESDFEAITSNYGTYTRSITVSEGVSSFSLVFSMTTDSNARIDDISIFAGEPEPFIKVTTQDASGVLSVSGKEATLNGAISFINNAVIGDVSEVGFYYKKIEGSTEFTKVSTTVSAAFHKSLTDLAQTTNYTFKAYAIYKGTEFLGEEKSFATETGSLDPKELTFGFTSNPGGWPAADNITNIGKLNKAGEYSYTLDNVTYSFSISNGVGIKATNCLGVAKSGARYIGLPYFSGYELKTVSVTTKDEGSERAGVYINSASDGQGTTIGSAKAVVKNGTTTWENMTSVSNTRYYIYFPSASQNVVITSIYLEYDPA